MSNLAICCCYFNPIGWQSRLENLYHFLGAAISQGADIWIIEGIAEGGQSDILSHGGFQYMYVPLGDLLWQKERLLNILIEKLPPKYDMVAWVDTDILFDNPYWVSDTIKSLQKYPVVQLFQDAMWLNEYSVPEYWPADPPLLARPSVPRAKELSPNEQVSFVIAHPGFAWAAKRDIIKQTGGLYDEHIAGSGDSIMAIGFLGWFQHPYYMECSHDFRKFCDKWCVKAFRATGGSVGYICGTIRHLWHGDRKFRRYDDRLISLIENGFIPDRDIVVGPNGTWQWRDGVSQKLKQDMEDYLRERREDG